jgi:hypothetical protein
MGSHPGNRGERVSRWSDRKASGAARLSRISRSRARALADSALRLGSAESGSSGSSAWPAGGASGAVLGHAVRLQVLRRRGRVAG